MKNINLICVILKGMANLVFAEILCLFINLTLAFSGSLIFKIISVFCTTVIFVGMICNYAFNTAKNDLVFQKRTETKLPYYRSFFIGAALSFPYIILWAVLFMSRKGIIGNFYGIYKIINGQFLQLYNIMNDGTEISAVTMYELLVMFVLTIVPFVSFVIAYKLTYRGIDIEKIQYKG